MRSAIPLGDVFEEHAQVDDVVMEHGQPDGLAVAVRSSPGSGLRPCEERFDVTGAVELIEPSDVRVVVGEPVTQHGDRLDPARACQRPQGGRDVAGVADYVPADLGLGDVAGMLDRGPRRRTRVMRGLVDRALLEADLTQCCRAFREPVRGRRGHIHGERLSDRCVEVGVGELNQGLVEPQAHHWSGVAKDLTCPVRTPSQSGSDADCCAYVGLVGQCPPQSNIDPRWLGQQQFQIRPQAAIDHQPGQPWPRLEPVEIDETNRCWPSHPDVEVAVAVEEPAGCGLALRTLRAVHAERIDEADVVAEQITTPTFCDHRQGCHDCA